MDTISSHWRQRSEHEFAMWGSRIVTAAPPATDETALAKNVADNDARARFRTPSTGRHLRAQVPLLRLPPDAGIAGRSVCDDLREDRAPPDEGGVPDRRDEQTSSIRLVHARDQSGARQHTIDCFDGMVVSWSIGTSPNAELVNSMLHAAIHKLTVSGDRLVVHSDRGGHYPWPGRLSRSAEGKWFARRRATNARRTTLHARASSVA